MGVERDRRGRDFDCPNGWRETLFCLIGSGQFSADSFDRRRVDYQQQADNSLCVSDQFAAHNRLRQPDFVMRATPSFGQLAVVTHHVMESGGGSYPGTPGPEGQPGPQGPQGIPGTNGSQGPQGVKGDTGDAGPQGIQGNTGSQGPQGNPGSQGIQGDPGADGAQGPQGNTGSQGIQGNQGPPGNDGAPGSQGIQGIQGNTGSAGPGVVTGGTAGQVLAKIDSTNFNTQWVTPSGAAPAGVLDDSQFSILQSDGTLNAASGVQTWCGTNKTGQDAFTLAANTTYKVRGQLIVNTGTTTHTTALAWALSGATITDFQYQVLLWSAAANAIATVQSTVHVTGVASKVLNATSTAVYTNISFEGILVSANAGTITPQINFSANPTGTNLMKRGSWISLSRLGINTVTVSGGWA